MALLGDGALFDRPDPEPDTTLEAFFPPSFMREHTEFSSFDAFRAASPWELDSRTAVDEVPTEALDRYVARTTRFDSWLAMRNRAAEAEVVERLTV